MDAGKLSNFDPNALVRRPDAAQGQGAMRFDAAAFTAQTLLDLAADGVGPAPAPLPTPPAPARGEPPAATTVGLLVNLSARALDLAAAERAQPGTPPVADYGALLRDAATPPQHTPAAAPTLLGAQVHAQVESALRQALTPPLPPAGMPGRPNPREESANGSGPRRAAAPLPDIARGTQAARVRERAEDRTGLPRAVREDATPSATRPDAAPLPLKGEAADATGLMAAAVPLAHAAAVAAQQTVASVARRDDDPVPRVVPELMAQFFARSEAQPRTRLSFGKLLLAAAALAVVLLVVL